MWLAAVIMTALLFAFLKVTCPEDEGCVYTIMISILYIIYTIVVAFLWFMAITGRGW
jgi:heme/copper-type cytochrome/quinol oxidase subunit 4